MGGPTTQESCLPQTRLTHSHLCKPLSSQWVFLVSSSGLQKGSVLCPLRPSLSLCLSVSLSRHCRAIFHSTHTPLTHHSRSLTSTLRHQHTLPYRYPLILRGATQAPRAQFDNLYLDFNGVLHLCTHGAAAAECGRTPTEDEMIATVFAYLERIIG